MPPRYQSTLLSFEEKLRNLADLAGQPGHRAHARIGAGLNRAGLGQSLIQLPDAAETGAAAAGQLLVLSAVGASIASGGDYVTFDTEVYRRGFDGFFIDAETILWPASAVGSIQVEFAWDTYDGGGTVEIEVDGAVPEWGMVGSSTSGQEGCKSRGVDIAAGQAVRIKITQTSGSAQTANVTVEFEVQDPVAPDAVNYRSVVLADNPVAYWRLGEASGTTAADETGNGHSGTYAGVTLGTAGLISNDPDTAATFVAASSSRVEVADHADLEFTGTAPFTVEAWVDPGALTNGVYYQVLSKDTNVGGSGWELYLLGAATTEVWFSRRDSAGADLAEGSLPSAGTHHIVGTFDGTDLVLYVDAVAVDRTTSSRTMPGNTSPVWIGNESASPSPFEGVIDEVAIYDRALRPAEIWEHYVVGTRG